MQPSTQTIEHLGAAGVYSFCKAIYLKCTANASSHTINNVKIYSDGANGLGTGVDLRVGCSFH